MNMVKLTPLVHLCRKNIEPFLLKLSAFDQMTLEAEQGKYMLEISRLETQKESLAQKSLRRQKVPTGVLTLFRRIILMATCFPKYLTITWYVMFMGSVVRGCPLQTALEKQVVLRDKWISADKEIMQKHKINQPERCISSSNGAICLCTVESIGSQLSNFVAFVGPCVLQHSSPSSLSHRIQRKLWRLPDIDRAQATVCR